MRTQAAGGGRLGRRMLERSEAVRSLKLPPASTLRECAKARNAYTRRRLLSDFHAGLA